MSKKVTKDPIEKTLNDYFGQPYYYQRVLFGYTYKSDGDEAHFKPIGGACHANMGHAAFSTTKKDLLLRYYSELMPREDKAIAAEFWAWLFSDKSPYREYIKKYDIQVHEIDGYPRYFSVALQPTLPSAQIVVGLSIAARLPREHPDVLSGWHRLVSDGFGPTVAWYLAHSFTVHLSHIYANSYDLGHAAIGNAGIAYIKGLIDGKPIINENQQLGVKGYSPIMNVWCTTAGIRSGFQYPDSFILAMNGKELDRPRDTSRMKFPKMWNFYDSRERQRVQYSESLDMKYSDYTAFINRAKETLTKEGIDYAR